MSGRGAEETRAGESDKKREGSCRVELKIENEGGGSYLWAWSQPS